MDAKTQNYIEEYRKTRQRCPNCGSAGIDKSRCVVRFDPDNIEQYKDTRKAICQECSWQGLVHDLVTGEDI